MQYKYFEDEKCVILGNDIPVANNEVSFVNVGIDDIVNIAFTEPGNMKYVASNALVVNFQDTAMYIDTIDGDICGWVKYEYIDKIEVVGNRKTYKSDKSVDMVNHPKHYKSESGLEVIDVIKAFTADLKGYQATDTGNIIKYILRWPHKNGLEDLKKARWYLDDLINTIENN